MTKQRNIGLDVVKSLAILLVVSIHVSAQGIEYFGPGWTASTFYDSGSRVAVPLFFMASGALLLGKQESTLELFRRIARLLLPLVAWSMVYVALNSFYGIETEGGYLAWIQGPVIYHFWFFYTIIAAYLFLPIMRGSQERNGIM